MTKFFVIVMIFVSSLSLFGQVQFQKMDSEAVVTSSLGVDDQNRVWFTSSMDAVYAQEPVGSNSFVRVGSAPGMSNKKRVTSTGIVMMPVFPPEGHENLFSQTSSRLVPSSDGRYVSYVNLTIWQATLGGGAKKRCESYTIEGTGEKPTQTYGGPFYNPDGTYFVVGRIGSVPTLFQLGKMGPDGVCDLRDVLKDVTTDKLDIIQARKYGGKIITERSVVPDPLNLLTEVAIYADGKFEVLVGSARSVNPKTLAAGSIDLVWDLKNKEGFYTYRGTDKITHAIRYPSFQEIYNSSNDGWLNVDIRGLDFKSPFAILGGSSRNLTAQDKVVMVNTNTKARYLVASYDKEIQEGFKPLWFPFGTVGVNSFGVVYFAVRNTAYLDVYTSHIFEAKVSGVSTFEAPTVVSFTADKTQVDPGSQVTLSWSTTNANSVEITGLGSVPLSGSRLVTISETTTFTLTATGYGGSNKAEVTVVVAPPKPTITKLMSRTGEVTTKFARGSLVTAFGTDMASVVTDEPIIISLLAQATTRPWPESVGGCRVKICGRYAPVSFAMTSDKLAPHFSQVDFQMPRDMEPSICPLVVESVSVNGGPVINSTKPMTVEIVDSAPKLFGQKVPNLFEPDISSPAVFYHGNWEKISSDNPAVPGRTVKVIGTGFGEPTIPLKSGVAPKDVGLSDYNWIKVPFQAWMVTKVNGDWKSWEMKVDWSMVDETQIGVDHLQLWIPEDVLADPDQKKALLYLVRGEESLTSFIEFDFIAKTNEVK